MRRGASSRSFRSRASHAREWPISSTARSRSRPSKGSTIGRRTATNGHDVRLEFRTGDARDGVVYIAPAGNHAYLGPAPEAEMVEQIRRSAGPSGANIDYLRALATVLRELEIDDPHVFELERLVLTSPEPNGA